MLKGIKTNAHNYVYLSQILVNLVLSTQLEELFRMIYNLP